MYQICLVQSVTYLNLLFCFVCSYTNMKKATMCQLDWKHSTASKSPWHAKHSAGLGP